MLYVNACGISSQCLNSNECVLLMFTSNHLAMIKHTINKNTSVESILLLQSVRDMWSAGKRQHINHNIGLESRSLNSDTTYLRLLYLYIYKRNVYDKQSIITELIAL